MNSGGRSKKQASSSSSSHPPLQPIKINTTAKPTQEEEKFAPNGAGYIEEQVLLRVPPKLASQLRDHIKRQQNTYSDFHGPDVNFTFEDGARGLLFNFGSDEYVGTLVDLPCVIESLKTVDNTNYYKSADVGQMIVIHDASEEDTPVMHYDSDFKFHHGITPPTRSIRKKRFKRTSESRKQDISAVEEEVIKLMKGGSLSEEIEVVEASVLQEEGTPASTPQIEDDLMEDIDDTPTPQPVVEVKKEKAKKPKKPKKEKKKEEETSQPSTPSGSVTTPKTSLKISLKKPATTPTAMSPSSVSPQPSPRALSPNPYSSSVGTPPPFFSSSQGPLSPQVTPSPQVTSPIPQSESYEGNIDQYLADTSQDKSPTPNPTPMETSTADYRSDPAYHHLKEKERALISERQSIQAKIQETEEQCKKEQNNIILMRLEKKKQDLYKNLAQKLENLSTVQQEIAQKESSS